MAEERRAVRTALSGGPLCVSCLAAASGLAFRRVADELTSIAEEATGELMTREARCRGCSAYRFVFRLLGPP
jgi:hypothetical protein